jgi:hypothetical protein
LLLQMRWKRLVLDECQAAGSDTRDAQMARLIKADHVLLLSGKRGAVTSQHDHIPQHAMFTTAAAAAGIMRGLVGKQTIKLITLYCFRHRTVISPWLEFTWVCPLPADICAVCAMLELQARHFLVGVRQAL